MNGPDGYITTGGRVLGVTAKALGIGPAIERVYQATERIRWEGVHYRKDIGNKALNRCWMMSGAFKWTPGHIPEKCSPVAPIITVSIIVGKVKTFFCPRKPPLGPTSLTLRRYLVYTRSRSWSFFWTKKKPVRKRAKGRIRFGLSLERETTML